MSNVQRRKIKSSVDNSSNATTEEWHDENDEREEEHEKETRNVNSLNDQCCEKCGRDRSRETESADCLYEGLHDVLEQLQQDLEHLTLKAYDLEKRLECCKKLPKLATDDVEVYNDRRQSKKPGELPEKEFHHANSLLTDLYEIKHIRTIYNIFIVTLIFLFLSTAVSDIMETGTTHLGIKTIMVGFGKISSAFIIWSNMLLSTFALYAAFTIWAQKHQDYEKQPALQKLLDYGALIGFLIFQICLIIFPAKAVIDEDLPTASSLALLMEQVRLLMKNHAFVRSNTSRVMMKIPPPNFSKFLYFMFAPTLLYRDNYPRTAKIRWTFVLWHILEMILVIFYEAFIFERFLIPVFHEFGTHAFELRAFILSIFGTVMPGIMTFLCGFYCLLHAWLNVAAEVLRFADRMFYKDWWNTTSYDAFYRKWNVVVHDWLYAYIYKDMYEYITRHHKALSMFTVFFVSAVFHEYILAVTFRFFYPVLFFSFAGFGLLFTFITWKCTKIGGNIFMWLTICLGNGIVLSLYSMEYFARINCAPYENRFLDVFIPRSWICHQQQSAT